VADTQWQIVSSRSTAGDTQRQIHSGRYTAVDTLRQIPVSDTRQQIAASDKQQQMYSGRYSSAYTTQQTQGQIHHVDIYTVTDIQPDTQYEVRIHIHSCGYKDVLQDTQYDIHSG
jgi:hypothetical protein